MSYIIVATLCFFSGLFLGMWLVKHPEDAHGYEQRALERLKQLVCHRTQDAIPTTAGVGSKVESVHILSGSGGGDSSKGSPSGTNS